MSRPTLDDLEAAARVVHAHMTPTPQYAWPLLAERCGCEVWVKHENHTPIGAFKIRGGLVYMEALKRAGDGAQGVIAASTGNHGQSVALAARLTGLKAVIVIPHGTSPGKIASMRGLGAELVEHGDDFQAAYEYSADLATERGLHAVGSYDAGLVRGVASYGLELFRAVPDLHTVYVPIGLGSGISGVIAARDALGLKTRVVGVVSEAAAAYALSFEKGEPVSTETAGTLAGGLACRVPVARAVEIIRAGADRVLRVSEDAMVAAIGHYFTDTHNLAEGAGAAALAALLQEKEKMAGKKVGLILSGGNLDKDLFQRALDTIAA